MKFISLFILLTTFVAGCSDHKDQQSTMQNYVPPVQQAAAPVYVNNPDPMTGVIVGMAIGSIMSNGMRYDGHNGYYDSHYAGPPRTIIKQTTIIKEKVSVAKPAPTAEVPKSTVAPTVTTKVKNPGDAAAEKAKIEMARKEEIKARLAAPKTESGFKSFSQKASVSTPSSSYRSSGSSFSSSSFRSSGRR